ncbi:MAG TPA: DNA polymerase III subunit delta' [Bacillota bacterium]|nr:DNA polymerase III subunit delta' [Bacillota bacterium]
MNTKYIVGQSRLVNMMDRTLTSGRVAHAYLFTGPAGSGKRTLSSLFAQALLCEGTGDKPCYTCRSCKQYESDNHPDVEHMVKEEDKTIISVDQVRDLRDKIKVKPYQSDRRIVFIHEAHIMTDQAQNALLKTLEEPPGQTNIILLADSENRLLSTIISRCQIFKVGSLSAADTAQVVSNRLAMPKEETLIFSQLSSGNPGRALTLAGNEDFKEKRDRLINGVGAGSISHLIELTPIFTEDRGLALELMDILIYWFRDILVLKETNNESLLVNMDKISMLEAQSKAFTSRALKDNIELIEESLRAINHFGNFQLTIENMLLGFMEGAI